MLLLPLNRRDANSWNATIWERRLTSKTNKRREFVYCDAGKNRFFPLPALGTRCFWGKLSWFSSQKKTCRAHGRICQHILDVLPSPVLCIPPCWCRSHCQLWFTDDRHDPWTPPAPTPSWHWWCLWTPTDNVCKTKEFCSRIFLETSAVQFFVSSIFVYCYFEENNIAFFSLFFLISCLLISRQMLHVTWTVNKKKNPDFGKTECFPVFSH